MFRSFRLNLGENGSQLFASHRAEGARTRETGQALLQTIDLYEWTRYARALLSFKARTSEFSAYTNERRKLEYEEGLFV